MNLSWSLVSLHFRTNSAHTWPLCVQNEDSIVSPVILDFNEASLMYVAIHILLCVTKSGNVHCDVTSDVMVINDKIRLNTH